VPLRARTPTPTRLAIVAAVAVASALLPRTGRADDAACIAASEQSLTVRKQGQLHEALKALALCAAEACPAEVKAECARRIGEVNAAMPTLILAAKDGAGNDLVDVKVSMDGAPLVSSLDGRPVSVDPGAHTFTFEAAGQPPVEKKLVLGEGEKDRREAVVIGPPPPAYVSTAPATPALPPPHEAGWSTNKTLAVVAGGLGVVGLGVGATLGAFALSSQNREKSDCSTSACPNRDQANADYNTASQDATGSTIACIAGGVLVATGAVLWFTAPKESASAPATGGARVRVVPSIAGRSGGVLLLGDF
jgi:hypothetical protein